MHAWNATTPENLSGRGRSVGKTEQWEVKTSYARDGNETSEENGPQRIPYIDYCGHVGSWVWGKDN